MGNGKSTAWWCMPAASRESIAQLSDYDVHYVLKSGQLELYALLFFHLPILMLWAVASWATGFANNYDGTGFNVVNHIWFFLAWEIFVVAWGFFATGFSFWVTRDGRLQKDSYSTRWRLAWWIFALAVALAAHIVHLVGAFYELDTCNSTLCTTNKGILIALIAVLFVLIVLESIEIWRTVVFRYHLLVIANLHANVFNERYEPAPGTVAPPPAAGDTDLVYSVPPSAPPESTKVPGTVAQRLVMTAGRRQLGHGLRKHRAE